MDLVFLCKIWIEGMHRPNRTVVLYSSFFNNFNKISVIFCASDKCLPPEHLRANGINEDSLKLTWSVPAHDDGSVRRYIVEKRLQDSKDWVRIAEVDGHTKWCLVQNLFPGQTFFFRVLAENPVGLSEPAELSISLQLPSKKG